MDSLSPLSIFISYSNKDSDFVNEVQKSLESKGIKVWIDDNLVSTRIDEDKIFQEGVRKSDAVVLILTPNSISSEFVLKEMYETIQFAKFTDDTKAIIPIILSDTPVPDFIDEYSAIQLKNLSLHSISEIVDGIMHRVRGTNGSKNYWLLTMNPQTWPIEGFQIGSWAYFNTHYFGKKRPEFDLFKEIRVGDTVFGYASGDIQRIICILKVIQAVGPSTTQGEGFEMEVSSLLLRGIKLDDFGPHIPDIASKLGLPGEPPELFFKLTKWAFDGIIQLTTASSAPYVNLFQPSFLTEGNHQATEDQLEFENDINSFASVISLKSVNPPLAIGLFGNWGSGKSFFMEKLSQRIDALAESKDPDNIEHVVQVMFNSWHYSDSNLWASLITQIFESLHDYSAKKEFKEGAINAIYRDLNLTTLQLEETERKLNVNQTHADHIQKQISSVEDIIEEKKQSLALWSSGKYFKLLLRDPDIQKDLEDLKTKFGAAQVVNDIKDIDDKLSEVKSNSTQILQSIKSMWEEGKLGWKWIFTWVLIGLIMFLIWFQFPQLTGFLKSYLTEWHLSLVFISTWLSSLWLKLRPYFDQFKKFRKKLENLKTKIEIEQKQLRLEEDDKKERLRRELSDWEDKRETLELEKAENEIKKKRLETELKEIGTGKQLAKFLAGKSADDTYLKQLGIISWIRKDFAKLNDLFEKQKTVRAKEKGIAAEVQIDRIVLYIDDLDRCNEEVVVKVLEAIHLLLAFPLFVVVVGVDPRWLNNALSEKYKNLFGKELEKNTGIPQAKATLKNQPEERTVLSQAATSYDYLEKIFQIPFALKPINKTGRETLLRYLVRNELPEPAIQSDTNITGNPAGRPGKAVNQLTGVTPVPEKTKGVSTTGKKQKQANEQPKIEKEKLVFTNAELAYMQKISFLFGHTPRTINRYVNIYRIIKAHGGLKVERDYSREEFMPIMFILAIIVGHSAFAEKFITAIRKSTDAEDFGTFLAKSNIDTTLKALVETAKDDIERIRMNKIKANMELISRFSFRTLLKGTE